MPGSDADRSLIGEPRQVHVPGGWSGWGGRFAALAALGLGIAAAAATVAGKTRWEGPIVVTVAGSHGLHVGDAFGLIPLAVGAVLAWWCLQRPSHRMLQALFEQGGPPPKRRR